jgi:hypothetical protein
MKFSEYPIKWEIVLGLSVPLQDALSSFADKLLIGESPDHIDAQICESLLHALTEEQRRVLKRSLLGKVIGSTTPTSKIIALFSHAISDCEVLASKADDLIQDGFKKMLERGEIDEFEWMKRVLKECPQLRTQCPAEILQDFLERLQRHDQNVLDDQCKKTLGEIRVSLEK